MRNCISLPREKLSDLILVPYLVQSSIPLPCPKLYSLALSKTNSIALSRSLFHCFVQNSIPLPLSNLTLFPAVSKFYCLPVALGETIRLYSSPLPWLYSSPSAHLINAPVVPSLLSFRGALKVRPLIGPKLCPTPQLYVKKLTLRHRMQDVRSQVETVTVFLELCNRFIFKLSSYFLNLFKIKIRDKYTCIIPFFCYLS